METRAGTFAGVLTMALAWAFIWALPGGVIELIDNIAPSAHSFTRRIDMWPQTLGLPGLMAGVLFSFLLPITEGRRRLAEVALSRGAAWGAAAGLLVGALVVWGLDSGLSRSVWLAAGAVAYAAFMGALSGPSATLLFRYVGRRLTASAHS